MTDKIEPAPARGALKTIKWDGALISSAGVYDMPIDAYHSNNCAGPSISSSGLRIIEMESPLKYWDTSYLNPNRAPPESKKHFSFGHAVHTLMLGEEGFARQFALRPESIDGAAWQSNRTVCRQWIASKEAAGVSVITAAEIEDIRGIARALDRHPLVKMGLLNGEIEKSLVWKDEETGIFLKARPDALPVNADLVADLKTTSDISARGTRAAISDYGYHMQMALIGIGMAAVLDRKISDEDYVLIFVEKTRPYDINVKPLAAESIAFGRMQIRRALRKMADCLAKNEWPGVEDDGQTAWLPDYYRKRIEREIQDGLLDNMVA